MNEKKDRLIRLSDALAAIREMTGSSEFWSFGEGYRFLSAVSEALRSVEDAERSAGCRGPNRRRRCVTMDEHKGVYSQRGDDYLIEAQKLCAEDRPKPPVMCPYCGHKMVHQYVYGDHFFRCPKCRAVSPDKDTEAEAYEAAMQRWQEPSEVVTVGKNINIGR